MYQTPRQPPKQRDKWVVRVDGLDTVTGKHKPKQLGTYKSQRSALANGGKLSKRSVQICRTVLQAALSEAGDEGLIHPEPSRSCRSASNRGEASS